MLLDCGYLLASAGGGSSGLRIRHMTVQTDFALGTALDVNVAHGDHGIAEGCVPDRTHEGVDGGSELSGEVVPEHLIRLQHRFSVWKVGVILVVESEWSGWIQVHHGGSIWCAVWT